MQKKGQISLFIIIALAILLIVVIGYILYNQFVVQSGTEYVLDATTPQTPLQTFVQQCISEVTRDGIERLGAQGGYIQVPDEIRQNRQMTVSPHPSRDYVIPYWINKDQILVPTIADMELELSTYISDTLPFCLDNYAILGETSEITAISEPKARVVITQGDVTVDVSFKLAQSSDGFTNSFERFVYKEPIALRSLIESAREFAEEIAKTTFLEDMTVDLMSISDPKIPVSNIQFRCDPKIWIKSRVQQELENILYYNVPSIRIQGAESRPFEQPESVYAELEQIKVDDFRNGLPYDPSEIPSDTYEHAHMYYKTTLASKFYDNNIQIATRYLPQYGMDFEVRPSSNGKMESSVGQGTGEYLSYLCIQVYHFTYDVSYPVEFVFRKESAFIDGSPFTLRFATSVNIKSNIPDKSPLRYTNPRTIGDYQSNEQLCTSLSDTTTTLIASDEFSTIDINNASVNYLCHKYVCPLGTTSLQDGRAVLRTQIPNSCIGAKLIFEAEGYKTKELFVDTLATQQFTTYQAEMTPLIDLNYKVVLGQNEDSIIPTELNQDQTAVIMLKDQFTDYTTYATFDDQTRPIITIPKVGSAYNVTVLVYEGSQLIGGYIGELPVDYNKLNGDLTFYTYEFIPRPDSDDEFSEAWNFLQNDDVYKQYHIPRFR